MTGIDPTGFNELTAAGGGPALGLAVTVFLAGFRHGFDIDHIAAITDIASASSTRRTSFFLATAYAIGHMTVVFGLGMAAVFAGASIPESWDAIAARFIGATLVWLGLYVLYSTVRYRRDFRMRSRWMLLVAGARRGLQWTRPTHHVVIEHDHEHPSDGHHDHSHQHEHGQPPLLAGSQPDSAVATRTATHTHTHKHVVAVPSDPFTEYSPKTTLVIGMVHGVGAETPTQILLFTTAAGLAGALGGVTLVALFVIGLLLGNTVLAIAATAGMSAGKRLPTLYLAITTTTGVISTILGCAYLFGRSILPG